MYHQASLSQCQGKTVNTATNQLINQQNPDFQHQNANAWLMPDGVEDLLSHQALKQENLRHDLLTILTAYGYELVSPPLIEFTESLLGHATEDLKRQTFKIIDQLTGRSMGVRADITPQIARIDANLQNRKLPIQSTVARYCYAGHVVYTLPKGLFGSRMPLQLGAEIFGANGLSADLEILKLLLALLDHNQLTKRCHLDIGHVAIFQTLSQLADLPLYTKEQLIDLYNNKALPELEDFCQKLAKTSPYAQDFYVLGEFSNDLAKLEEKLSTTAKSHPVIRQALDELSVLIAHLQNCNIGISVDISSLKGYHYHTGMVFNVYVANEPLPIVRGGRYVNPFAKNLRQATGFSCDLTRWQQYIDNPKKMLTVVPFLADTDLSDALLKQREQAIDALRQQGQAVIVALSEQDNTTLATHTLVYADGKWQQKAL
ncbi:ATP phosphoribosyltransferase regulatory subunit [Moraxella macacae 0408225]|uniref:ATP phosphoribosyltransferase regulatory subunit n=2 Tax=Pseudomonadota TaxID=1224 RepID=L2F7C0_9GAMM|nr:ATP phosphoribosyltransferase regulatory subunit [Moraxella macacae 0408225]